MEKLPQKIWAPKKFFINKNLSENFIDLTFIRNLGGFTKKRQKMALGAIFYLSIGQNFGRGKFWPKSFAPPPTNLAYLISKLIKQA